MIRDILRYPTPPSLEFGASVRFFNDELFELLQDLKDTIEANDLDALAAYQIGSSLSVIVIKKDGEFLEIINPVVVKREGSVIATESTAYFPGLSAKTKRYEKIKVMYSDREDNQCFVEADGEFSITLQRKIDYVYGSNFRVRLNDEERALFDSKLEFGTDSIMKEDCPTTFKRDKILNTFKYLFVLSLVSLLGVLFLSDENVALLNTLENYSMLSMLILLVIYFFYAQYEGKQYKNCTSCQIGNIIGTTAIGLAKLGVLFILTYFIF
jgi:peptide deformylase